MDQVSEAKDVKSMVPKFVRKWSSEEDDGNSSYQEISENGVADEHILADNSTKPQ